MQKEIIKLGNRLFILFSLYTVVSFLLFLRDDFILERISFLTNSPWILENGRVLAKALYVNSLPTIFYLFIIIGLFWLYFKALLLFKASKPSSSLIKIILGFSLSFLGITLISFPALSTDIFDYIAANRVLFVHKANPWLHPPLDFPFDDFIYLGSWKFRASVYGPVLFFFSSIVQIFAGNSIIANILGFKLLNAFFLILTIIVIKKYLKEFHPTRVSYGLALFAWNPLVYIEIIGNAHTDIIMAFFAVLAIYLLRKNRIVFSAVVLSFATLVKLSVLLFAPLIALWLIIKHKKNKAITFITVFSFALLIGFASLGEGMKGYFSNISQQFNLYLRSLPTILRFAFLKMGLSDVKAQFWQKAITIPLFSVGYFLISKKIKDKGLIYSIIAVMISYLLIAAPMLQPWYLIWFLPFVAFLPPSRLQSAALVFTFSSLIYYAVLFTSFYFSPLSFIWQVIMFIVIATPPIFVWFMPKNWYTQIKVKLFFLK